ncbi:hypothetical protein ACFL0Q_02585, partial [Thermodesulfobacteriota bacterium]
AGEREEIRYIHNNCKKWGKPIMELWEFPTIRDLLEIDTADSTVRIDDRVFRIPILIELDKDLNTTLRFQFDNAPSHKTLVDYCREMPADRYFLLIDRSYRVKRLGVMLGNSGFSFVAGRGREYADIYKIRDKKVFYDVEAIRKLLNIPSLQAHSVP